uniref:Gametocyte-specific factor 1 isoform X1 n=1 Tax=Phascolarctos cinereus TaxID=38626 RepID=A0A6P5II94_PHACI|nr:gametocyte-specific factor 1 isoform X1 [Phascolarctos cinereus]
MEEDSGTSQSYFIFCPSEFDSVSLSWSLLVDAISGSLNHSFERALGSASFSLQTWKRIMNHPDVANKLATCPFNARHQVPRAEIGRHISSCDDKSFIEQDVVSQSRNYRCEAVAVNTWQCPPCDEDWDKDLLGQSSTTFVWGTANCSGNNSPANNVVVEHKSNLASGMRVPRSLPSVLPWKSNGNAQ